MFSKSKLDGSIITSLLDADFYKFTMGQWVCKFHADRSVRYGFRNRTKGIRLLDEIGLWELRVQMEYARTLRFSKSELHYLRGTNEYRDRMFDEEYLGFLAAYQLPAYELQEIDGGFTLEFAGTWLEQIHWETIALSIINEARSRRKLREMSWFERDCLEAEGKRRLAQKIAILKKHPEITFTDFGTRRRFSFDWQDYVVEALKSELSPTQFLGTSNTLLAAKHGLLPMGTSAHEMFMVIAAMFGRTEEGLLAATDLVLKEWWDLYGQGLSIALTDTFGSDYFFRTIKAERAERWKGVRQDSGDPFEFAEKAIAFYEGLGINPKEKLIVFSDGLNIETIVELHEHFHGRIKVTFGWGTNLTNDLGGFEPLSLVIKILSADGYPAVKLSDNLAKALGDPEEVERYKRVFGYTTTFNQGVTY